MPSKIRPVPFDKGKAMRVLSKRQFSFAKKLRREGLKPVMYRRANNAKGWSVHNPFLDAKRRANLAFVPYAQRTHPQAWDTENQRSFLSKHRGRKAINTGVKRVRKAGRKKKSFFDLFAP